jgi:hypothetical protein
MARQIGERVSILAGLMMENLKRSAGDRSDASLERSFGLLVSARRRFALRSRITGAEVSFMRIIEANINPPACFASVKIGQKDKANVRRWRQTKSSTSSLS